MMGAFSLVIAIAGMLAIAWLHPWTAPVVLGGLWWFWKRCSG